jgi:hypothetical protein
MKVFVFGAGASKGSQEGLSLNANQKAPLVDELFSSQYDQLYLSHEEYIQCQEGRLDCGGSVEQWLSTRWAGVESLREI